MPINKKPIYDEQTKSYSLKTGRIEAVVGDEKVSDKILPRLKLKVWDNECNISVGLLVDEAEKEKISVVEGENGLLTWKQGRKEAKFYPLDATEQHEEGGYEFEVVLHEPPESNVLEFSLNVPKELKFYCQPELTQKEKDEGAEQPENVIGSYAVYHASKGNMHKGREEAEKYKTGKAFHIYRPKIIDANGDWIWGELNIDENRLILSVTIDKNWLDKAVYPVRVDPTFGYTIAGSNDFGTSADGLRALLVTAPSGDNLQVISISFYTANTPTGEGNNAIKCAVYRNSDLAFLGESEERAEYFPRDTWHQFNFSTPVSIESSEQYLICVYFRDPDAPRMRWSSSVSGYTRYWGNYSYPSWPDNPKSGNSHTSTAFSLYATCEEASSDPTVTTSPATNVDHESATLNGSLTDLGSESSVDVYFEYRKSGASTWSSTTAQTKTATGTFSANISNLDAETEYEFRAVVEWDSGAETAYSGVAYFETEAEEVVEQGEAHLTATSKLSVSGCKIAKAEAPVTAVTAITAQGKKIAKAQVHITATTVLSVSGVGEEIQVEQGQAHVKTLSSFDVAGEKRARSPPAVLTGETEISSEGRKIAKGQVSLTATSDIKVTGRKVAKTSIPLIAESGTTVEGQKIAKGTITIDAQSDISISGNAIISAPGTAHITAESKTTAEGKKTAKGTAELTGESGLQAQGSKTAKGRATLTSSSKLSVQGRKLAKQEISFTADSELSAEGGKIAQTEIALDSTTKFGTTSKKVAKAEIRLDSETKIETEGKAIKQGTAEIKALSLIDADGKAIIPFAGTAHIKATSETKVSGGKIAKGEANVTANSETDLTGQKITSGEAKLTADSKLTAQGKAVKQGRVALTATSEITVESYGEVHDITGEAHVKAVSRLSVTGRKIITGKADIKADSEINVQAKTRRQGKAAAIATSKLTTIGEYIPPYKQVIVTLSIQEREVGLGLQEREVKLEVE